MRLEELLGAPPRARQRETRPDRWPRPRRLYLQEEGTLRRYLRLKGRFEDVRCFGLLHPEAPVDDMG